MAQIDDLTGLANRAMFLELLNRAIIRVDRSKAGLALYFVDLDRFKRINDTLGHRLGLKVIVEGVETLEQLAFLQRAECDAAQGFYIARPMPAEQVADWLETAGQGSDDRVRVSGSG